MDPGASGAGVDDEAEALGARDIEAGGYVGTAGDDEEVDEEGEGEESGGKEPAPLAARGGGRPERGRRGGVVHPGVELGPVEREVGGRR